MAILPKDYLSIDDVAEYFNNLGYNYDLSTSRDSYRIRKDIYDLVLQEKITSVFKFFDTYNFKSAYYYVTLDQARKIFIEKYSYINIKGHNGIYCYEDGSKPKSDNICSFIIGEMNVYDIKEDYNICCNDIYIPIKELDSMFITNTEHNHQLSNDTDKIPAPSIGYAKPKTNEQLIKELAADKAKIIDLESKLEQFKSEQTNMLADNDQLLHARTANNASKIIAALTSELLNMELTQPFANNSNGKIMTAIEKQGNTVSKDVIGYWLKLAHENSI